MDKRDRGYMMPVSTNYSHIINDNTSQHVLEHHLNEALSGSETALNRFIIAATPIVQSRVFHTLVRHRFRAGGRNVRQEMEDLVQESFIYLFENNAYVLRSWDAHKGLRLTTFIGLVTGRYVNKILTRNRHTPWREAPATSTELENRSAEKPSTPLLSSEAEGLTRDFAPEELVASRQILRHLLQQLEASVSPQGIELFRLLFVECLDTKEISSQMDMSRCSVYSWRCRLLSHARQILEKIMSDRNEYLAAA